MSTSSRMQPGRAAVSVLRKSAAQAYPRAWYPAALSRLIIAVRALWSSSTMWIKGAVFVAMSASVRSLRCMDRKDDRETRSAAGIVSRRDLSAVRLHDGAAKGQPQSHAVGLRREEGI